jgi:hypothetical protein
VSGCINDQNEKYYNNWFDIPKDQDIYACCNDLPESRIVSLLIDYKFVIGEVVGNDDGFPVLQVNKVNHKLIKEIFAWIRPPGSFINFGIFSLNLKSGIAYCRDKKTYFRPGSRYYGVLRQLMERQTHSLTYDEIDLIKSTKPKDDLNNNDSKIYAVNAAKYLRKKLHMVKGFGELLHIYKGKGFVLEPNQI